MWIQDSYKNWFRQKLIEIKADLGFNDFNIEVYNEQEYTKKEFIKENTISVVLKYLASSLIVQARTQPIQMLIMSEENSLSVANSIINKFCEDYNNYVYIEDTTYIKNIYSTPVVLNNFERVGTGYRSVLYVNATLIILENVIDIKDFKVRFMRNNGTYTSYTNLDPLSCSIGYSMEGDTEAFGGGMSTTEKDFSTMVMTMNLACVSNDVITKCIEIMKNTSTFKGNDVFYISFKIGTVAFDDFPFKLVSCSFTTAKNSVPSLAIGFRM